jgi:hypothetical protein
MCKFWIKYTVLLLRFYSTTKEQKRKLVFEWPKMIDLRFRVSPFLAVLVIGYFKKCVIKIFSTFFKFLNFLLKLNIVIFWVNIILPFVRYVISLKLRYCGLFKYFSLDYIFRTSTPLVTVVGEENRTSVLTVVFAIIETCWERENVDCQTRKTVCKVAWSGG